MNRLAVLFHVAPVNSMSTTTGWVLSLRLADLPMSSRRPDSNDDSFVCHGRHRSLNGCLLDVGSGRYLFLRNWGIIPNITESHVFNRARSSIMII